MSVNKQANSGIPEVSAHRELSPHEEDALEAGKSRWLPRVFQSYGTPIPELMASPLKTGLIFGVPAGIIGAGLGSALGGAMHGPTGKGYAGAGALIGGLGAGGLAAIAAAMDREAKNEGLEELMRRMPEGAAKRDLLADPQYQSDFLGWDNNKIVATARARYYRPTERFSKRTEDMAAARSRYNERNKSSSVNKETIMSQRPQQNEKQALGGLGTTIGALYGAASGNPGDRWRSAGRGAIKGLGWDAGSGMGAGVGALLGMPLGPVGMAAGGAIGGIGGGLTGKNIAGALLGPYETDDAKLERLLAARAKRKSAPPAETEDNNTAENKKAAHALLNNKTLTLAEKMAAYKNLLIKHADEPIPLGPGATPVEALMPEIRPAPLQRLPLSTVGQRVVTPPYAMGGESAPPAAAPTNVAVPPPASVASDKPAPSGTSEKWRPPATIPDISASSGMGGVRDKRTAEQRLNDKVYWEFFRKNLSDAKTMGGKFLGFLGDQHAKAMDSGKAFAQWLKPEVKPPVEPSLLEKLKPYAPYAAVGAGGLGALALADYLSRRKSTKKKRRAEPQDEEYDMPKAANVNWYKLTSERYKRANALIPYVAPAAAKAIATVAPQVVKIPGAASAASKIPSWLLPAAGTTAGVGGVYGLSKLLGGKDPSMMDNLKAYAPYAAAGLGAAGLLGGAAYMGNQSGKNEVKKKKKPGTENQLKQANALTLARAGTAMVPYSRLGSFLSSARAMLSDAAPYVNPFSGKALPFYSGMMLGDISGSTGGFGTRGALASLFKGKDPSMLDNLKAYAPYAAAGLGGAGLLGGAAYMGSRAGKDDDKKKKKPEGEKEANLGLGNAGTGAAAGAAALGLGGGLYGLMSPGYEEDPVTGRRRRRSRLMGALRGLTGGATLGGVAGGAIGHFAGGNISEMLNKYLAQKQEGGAKPGATPAATGISTRTTMQADPLEAAKTEAAQPVTPQKAVAPIPQGPTNANATMGGAGGAGQMPAVQNTMPGPAPDMNAVQNTMTPPNPVPQSPVVPQGPATASATMGGMPAQQFKM